MIDGLDALERFAGSLIASLDGPGRGRLARKLATALRRGQAARIARQQDPGGQPFAPRAGRAKAAAKTHPVRFLYRSGNDVREVAMKSWERRGASMIGYDIEARAVRTFRFDRVVRFLPDSAELKAAAARAATARRGSIRRQTMFRKLRSPRYLRSGSSDDEVWAGFSGRVAAIAGIHQEGGSDWTGKPGKSPRARYPQRRLLGLTADNDAELLNLMLDHVAAVR